MDLSLAKDSQELSFSKFFEESGFLCYIFRNSITLKWFHILFEYSFTIIDFDCPTHILPSKKTYLGTLSKVYIKSEKELSEDCD